MKKQESVRFAGSYNSKFNIGAPQELNKEETISVTVRLRRKKSLPSPNVAGTFVGRNEYAGNYGATFEDAELVENFAHEYLLSTAAIDLARRSIILSGKIKDFEHAFQVVISGLHSDLGIYRVLEHEISIPADLQDIIQGVFGLDNPPIARPMFQVAKSSAGKFISHAAAPQSVTADQLAKIYGFPAGVTGKGQCIAIIELGGGFRNADLKKYFTGLGIKKPLVKAVSVDGGKNAPSTPDGADGEVMLDIEVAGAVAPDATIVVYFAPNTDQGFLNAITTALHDLQNNPSVISISWGASEINWTQQALMNFDEAFKAAATLGVTICAASGDAGSSDGETDGKVHVDFPSSSAYVLACGGTRLELNKNKIISETVWHASATSASGGGVSDYFPVPSYQSNANVPVAIDTKFKGRGVPDVAGNADPDTGYRVLVDGQEMVIGGTSAVAPLMAGLLALLNERNGKPAGYIHEKLYRGDATCRDITEGDNKTTAKNTGYTAGKGWDACTGLGVFSAI